MGDKKKKDTHGFVSNLIFMIREQWNFEKKGIVIPFIRIPSDVVVSLLGIMLPKIVLDAIDKSVPAAQFIGKICLLTLILIILKYISNYTEHSINKNATRLWHLHFAMNKVWKSVDMDYDFFSAPEGKIKGEKAHIAQNRNIGVNMMSFYPGLVELIKNALGLIVYSVVLSALNPFIIILLILSYLIVLCVTIYVEKWVNKSKDERTDIDRRLNYIEGNLSINNKAAKDIRLYGMKGWIDDISDDLLKAKSAWEIKIASKGFMRAAISALIMFIRNGGAYIYLIWKVVHNDISIGEFTLFFGAITGFSQWLQQIVDKVQVLSVASYQVDDYRYFLDLEDKMNRGVGVPLPPKESPIEITLENVSFKYRGSNELIIKDINLTIRKGEKLAVVGANGAGKTTLVMLICGLLEPTCGRILMNGTDIREFNRDEYYKMVTVVFQNVCLLPESIAKNITFSADEDIDWGRLDKCAVQADIKEKIESLVDGYRTNLIPSVVVNGIELSGGENQKLMLARALYKNAPLIILDEPTAALDPIAENLMYLKYNALTENRTAVYISHRLSSTRFCDRIILLENSIIAESGTHDELMALQGNYRYIFDIQSRYYQSNIEVLA